MEKSTVFNFKNNILMLLVLALGFFVELFFFYSIPANGRSGEFWFTCSFIGALVIFLSLWVHSGVWLEHLGGDTWLKKRGIVSERQKYLTFDDFKEYISDQALASFMFSVMISCGRQIYFAIQYHPVLLLVMGVGIFICHVSIIFLIVASFVKFASKLPYNMLVGLFSIILAVFFIVLFSWFGIHSVAPRG
ncbi:hypothetical protein [Carnimonas nigrificans]|uniref:hypothetical protein n=1 Tax=Carnimonas nigrificans TaxID=64323 RepID=UPI0012EB77A0|nr:hypothetical protein [Carnimonas nigrificans]